LNKDLIMSFDLHLYAWAVLKKGYFKDGLPEGQFVGFFLLF
jgi:hypothetical protein